MVDGRLVIGMSEPAAAPAARAGLRSSTLEDGLRRDGPGVWIRSDLFWALISNRDQVERTDVIAGLLDFARPALEHSQVPEELVAWSVTLGDWHVVFYFSLPAPPAWQKGEHYLETFGALPSYFYVERDRHRPEDDVLVVHERNQEHRLRQINASHSDFPGETPWGYLQRTTGLTLDELVAAIPSGEPTWLIHEGAIVWQPPPSATVN